MQPQNLINDIPSSTARNAFYATSFSPEKRGDSARSEYAETLAGDYEKFRENAVKGGTLDLFEAEFARYRSGYRNRYLKYLHSMSRCMSSMITGPSNFPVRQQRKRNDIASRRSDELVEFRVKARRAILRVLRPDLRPIMAGDADAVERLEVEVEKLERLQLKMREANKVAKSKKLTPEEKIRGLHDQGFAEKLAIALLQPDFAGRIGFADYQLTNNSANIRRIRARIVQVSEAKATPDTEVKNDESGITLEDCPGENRVKLFFPGKPSAEVRKQLKDNGFRWKPTVGCWQAYRNYRSQEFAKTFVEQKQEVAA